MKVLVVDDDQGTLNAVRIGLISYGHDVITATNGKSALNIIEAASQKKESINLLLTDLKMPEMNGLELVLTARVINPDLYAIIMTAYGDEAYVREKVASLGGCGYVDKPFKPEKLNKLIEETWGFTPILS